MIAGLPMEWAQRQRARLGIRRGNTNEKVNYIRNYKFVCGEQFCSNATDRKVKNECRDFDF